MPRAKKKIHYIYKTTCLVTGRYYIGMHSTNNLDDGYLGSGDRLRRSVRKHGKLNHKKEILEYCDSRELLVEREKQIVTLDLVFDPMCMNLKEGGTGGGGFAYMTEEQRKAVALRGRQNIKLLRTRLEYDNHYRTALSNSLYKQYSLGKRLKQFKYDWTGKKHKPETIEKIKLSSTGKHIGEYNSQFGTRWMTKDGSNKKIKREHLAEFISDGWKFGRYISK